MIIEQGFSNQKCRNSNSCCLNLSTSIQLKIKEFDSILYGLILVNNSTWSKFSSDISIRFLVSWIVTKIVYLSLIKSNTLYIGKLDMVNSGKLMIAWGFAMVLSLFLWWFVMVLGWFRSAVSAIDILEGSTVIMNWETLTLESIAKNTERKAELINEDE